MMNTTEGGLVQKLSGMSRKTNLLLFSNVTVVLILSVMQRHFVIKLVTAFNHIKLVTQHWSHIFHWNRMWVTSPRGVMFGGICRFRILESFSGVTGDQCYQRPWRKPVPPSKVTDSDQGSTQCQCKRSFICHYQIKRRCFYWSATSQFTLLSRSKSMSRWQRAHSQGL